MKYLMGACILTLAACGKDSSKSSSQTQAELVQEEQGIYRAVLATLNPGVNQNKSFGTAAITVAGDEFKVKINMINTPGNVTHLQEVRTGKRCPEAQDDANKDGFIDHLEGSKAFGNMLIPLDGDLNSQIAENKKLPQSNSTGSYSYSETASLSRLLADLKQFSDLELNLSGRHFVVYSIPASVKLPATVAAIEGLTPNQSLPIACGKIVRIPEEN